MPVALYRPRRPKASPLWQCLSEHRDAFFEQYQTRFQKQDGRLRPEVKKTLDAFEVCGDLSHGFARLHCDHCGHDYLIAFSCKQRYFCPSCHQKKVQQFGEFVRHEVVQKVPHRQVVLTIPKRIRKAFQLDRQLLTELCQAAWLSLRDVIRMRLGTPTGQPGVIIAIQTFGDYMNFHPHLHILITDGAFVGTHTFHTLPRTDWEKVTELLRNRVLKFFVEKKKLAEKEAQKMRQWHHSGFGIHSGHRIQKDDHDGLENLAQYIVRNPFSLEKMTYMPETGEVIYRSKAHHETKRLWKTFDGPAFIAAITRHIPTPGQHLVRYYGAYSNRARGERRKAAGGEPLPSAAETPLPNRRSYADFANEREREEQERHAKAFDQGLPVKPHPDAYVPSLDSQTDNDIEIIELPKDAIPHIPKKKWRELIQKVWEVDPYICPHCARTMRITGILEDPEAAIALLNTLGWLAFANDSQGARAPPPGANPETSELPLSNEIDGVVYEPEPWEQARQERIQRYAQQRDQVAGIIVYDGDPNGTHSEAHAWPQTIDESQTITFQDDIDQSPPPQWDEYQTAGATQTQTPTVIEIDQRPPKEWDTQQWDQTPQCWNDTPLAIWANQERQEIQWARPNTTQPIPNLEFDQRPPKEWDTRQWDQTPQYWRDSPLAKWTQEANRDGIDPIPKEDEPVFFTD